MSIERVTLWVCDECDYWRSDKSTGLHTLANPADPNGRMLTHEIHPVEYVRATEDGGGE